jgi:hypothetical protein
MFDPMTEEDPAQASTIPRDQRMRSRMSRKKLYKTSFERGGLRDDLEHPKGLLHK